MKHILLIGLFFISCISFAGGTNETDIYKQYRNLIKEYDINISVGKYREAYDLAIEQLSIDPSDSIAYLRLAIAAQHLDVNRRELFERYSPEISERDDLHIQLKSIASALLQKKD